MQLTALLLFACAGDPAAEPELSVSTDALDLGVVAVGAESTADFVLENVGGGTVELLSVQLTDGDSAAWRVERGDDLSLEGGESLTVSVTFQPVDEGTTRGRIQVRSDAPDASTVLVDLSGEGGPSELDEDGDGWSVADGDCNDNRDDMFPGNPEVCDGRDNDCADGVPENEADADGDGVRVCEGDCRDDLDTVYPGAPEICDDLDSDCDGDSSDRDDVDGDGFAVCDGDCDDGEPAVNPGETEVCDTLDNDCSGDADDIDNDADGHSICHPAGDCDDNDHLAYPVIVDPEHSGDEDGTEASPYNTWDEALAALDGTCNTIYLGEGSYEISLALDASDLTVMGAGAGTVVIPSGERHFDVSGGAELGLVDVVLQSGDANGDGGSIYAVESTVWAEGVTWIANQASGDGGAISVSAGTLSFQDCLLETNTAADDGGAVASVSSTLNDVGSVYSDNTGTRGGAIVGESSRVNLDQVLITGNTASDVGGGVALVASDPQILRSTFTLNTAANGGGGMSFTDVNTFWSPVSNNLIQDNQGGSYGGGVDFSGSVAGVLFSNNTVVANAASDGAGVALRATDTGAMLMTSNLICFSAGDGLYAESSAGALLRYNSVYGSSTAVNWSGSGYDGVDGNNTDNPLFVDFVDNRDPTDDDMSLSSGSPAINSGSPSYNDPDGSTNDRGHTGGPEAL
jgi:hypothetical protein